MKESKFIELLNLYVDQQIEPADAALLESEILRDPERRRVYKQYCRIQRACTLLVQQARPEVNVGEKLADTVAEAEEKVMEFPAPRRSYGRVVYIGGLLAACVAVVFVAGRSMRRAEAPAAPVGEQLVQITPTALTSEQVAAAKSNFQPVLVTHVYRLNNGSANPNSTSATAQQLSLDWMNSVKFEPLTVSSQELILGTQSAAKNKEREAQQRVFHSGPPQTQAEAESIAFRFQR